ncbi:MAG: hypothetical protein IT435_08050 [Phycisphaerales bacterium]|nr:hypothetical protein [Phycisphaerales bacterium]
MGKSRGAWGLARRLLAGVVSAGLGLSGMAMAGLAVVAVPANSAQAQLFMQGPGGNEGAISKRSVQLYSKILGFDKDQTDTLLTLHDGYLSEHKRISEEMQGYQKKIMDEAQESQDWAVFQGKEFREKVRGFAKEMEDSQKSFMEDAKGLCTPAQLEKWPALERHRKREMFLRFQFVAGVGVDVVDCTRRVGLAPEEGKASPEVKEAIESYELTLDRKLVDVERMARDAEEKAMSMMAGGDFQKIQEMMKKFSDEAIQIRNINRDGARRVSAVLPEDVKGKFDKEVQRRSFPRVYRKSYVTRALDAADKFKDLDADQKSALAEVRAGYERESGPMNDKWANAITEKEDKEGSSYLAMFNWGQKKPDDPVSEARKARKELDGQYRDKLLAVLKEDQKKQLPKEDAIPQGMDAERAEMMGDMDPDAFGGDEDEDSE